MKKIISIVLAFTFVLSLIACGGNQTTQAKVETEAEEYVPTGDPIKDEPHWPMGEFGFHEPPEELRHEYIYWLTKKPYEDRYYINFHNEKYGDLTLSYNTKDGTRVLFEGNEPMATRQLIIIGGDNPISIKQALADLRIGDNIANNFGKK